MTPIQRRLVAAELASLDTQPVSAAIVDGRFATTATCPHCTAEHVSRHGHANGLQRHRCRECGKTFSALTGTPLCGLHKRGLLHEQVPVLVAEDRPGVTMDCVLKAMNMTALSAPLRPFLTKDVVLCTDASTALAGAARQLGVEHHAVNLSGHSS